MNLEMFKEIDKTFNESMFITKVNNIFIKLFTAIMLDNLNEIRHFVNDDVLDFAKNILENVKSKGYRQMYDELNVKDTKIESFEVLDDCYVAKVFLQSRYLDYIINLSNGNVVSGNTDERVRVNYLLTFKKGKDTLKQGMIRKCPNCGASMNVNNTGICEYCDSVYNQSDYDWVLVKLEKVN